MPMRATPSLPATQIAERDPILMGNIIIPPTPPVQPFTRVVVNNVYLGGTLVRWEIAHTFADSEPYSFQLQVGRTGTNTADDWADVGMSVLNTFYAIDPVQRVWGKTNWTHYRVVLTTPLGVYYSTPEPGLGVLNGRDFRLAKELIRKEQLRFRLAGQSGYLIKRKTYGTRCTICTDFQTGEVLNPFCELCHGTGWIGGYYVPLADVYADLGTEYSHTQIDAAGMRGTTNIVVVKGRMLGMPQLFEDDVWVGKNNDRRYYVHSIQNMTEIRGVPIVAQIELRPAPFSDTIYEIQLPNQLPAVS